MASQAEYLDEPRFNQTFVLPANPSLGRNRPFRIKYADYGYGYRGSGYEERENSAVLLFFGSLLASRLVHVAKDELARKLNVRIINIDRPGIGGTDSAETSDAMRIWRGRCVPHCHPIPIVQVAARAHTSNIDVDARGHPSPSCPP